MTPVLVVEMTPVFAIVEADIAKSNVAAQMMDLRFFIVLLLMLNSRGVTWSVLSSFGRPSQIEFALFSSRVVPKLLKSWPRL
jgi:hypothetical protein